MFQLNPNLAVYLHRGPIDFRKNINGLAALVEHDLVLDPFASAVYFFGNRSAGPRQDPAGAATDAGCCKSASR
ncbi:MAG: IS66 family insertion sequence element accessory protein TnpB [Burkholderiaceae bacterium]